MGWIGTTSQVLHYLRVVGAKRDDENRPIVRGGIFTFLGIEGENAELVIDNSAEYLLGETWCNLVVGLNSTSYGLKVNVI